MTTAITELPAVNCRIRKLVDEFANGNVQGFVKLVGIKSHQNLNRIFNIDKRNNKYPLPSAGVLSCIKINLPNVNYDWLLTGEGEMLKGDTPSTVVYSVSQNKGVPYYDVDFIGGFDLVLNDQTKNPTYYIDFPAYNKADAWANITGHSMEPLIGHGDIIALKKIEDWRTYLLYGEVYGVITGEYRTVKRVRRSEKGEDHLRLVPLNPEYDEQDIPKSIVLEVFQIIGCAKRIF